MMRFKDKILWTLVVLLCGTTAAQSAQTVTIATVVNGIVTVDSSTHDAGDVVTVTVTPDAGYYIQRDDITVEATIDPGRAHAPGHSNAAPQVGYYIDLQGDQPDDPSIEASYTFTMPEEPYDVLITAHFQHEQVTHVTELAECNLTDIQYISLTGQMSSQPFSGVNIVVAKQADGKLHISKSMH